MNRRGFLGTLAGGAAGAIVGLPAILGAQSSSADNASSTRPLKLAYLLTLFDPRTGHETVHVPVVVVPTGDTPSVDGTARVVLSARTGIDHREFLEDGWQPRLYERCNGIGGDPFHLLFWAHGQWTMSLQRVGATVRVRDLELHPIDTRHLPRTS